MTNAEMKGDVAKALVAHVLKVTAASLADSLRPQMMLRQRTIGQFNALHTVLAGPGASEIVDVWHGKKVFSARRERGEKEWEIVNFKRGDWESGFLCAA